MIGGAVTEGLAWQWIFWLNVPIGLALLPLIRRLDETRGPARRLDLPGVALVSAGLLGVVFGLVRGNRTAGPVPAWPAPWLAARW